MKNLKTVGLLVIAAASLVSPLFAHKPESPKSCIKQRPQLLPIIGRHASCADAYRYRQPSREYLEKRVAFPEDIILEDDSRQERERLDKMRDTIKKQELVITVVCQSYLFIKGLLGLD